jgi:N6-adenosine-specific RNA methylase IME4
MSIATDIVLQNVHAARDLLSKARDATSAKKIVDIATAIEVYARRQKLTKESIDYAHEIMIDAMALLGEYLEAEKAAGNIAKGTRGQLRGRDVSGNSIEELPEKMPKLADRGIPLKVSMQSRRLAKVKRDNPDAFQAVKRSEKTYKEVHRETRRVQAHEAIKSVSNLTGKYRVLYADPPWKYGDAGYGSGPAEFHYPTMSIDELCKLPVKDIALDNSVLFIWVTSPLLEDVFKVINSWGFTYKASFVWDKVKHNVGHYVSVRHELLLIATRGSCTPDDQRLIDSVQVIERGEHSVKPEEFREYIEQMYPHGNKVEMFARKRSKGWDVWGNQI